MNLEEMKASATNTVNVKDSIEAPLLRLEVKALGTTIAPSTNELIVYVDKSNEETNERKTYIFNLQEKLGINEAFVLEPIFDGDKVILKSYVQKGNTKEEVSSEPIMMFEGNNYITTNYTNALISIVYPKNTDLVNYFLNTSIYGINNKNKVLTLDDIYFKDCFTEEDGNINASFNSLTVNCISSKTGKFRMDEEGNLRVKSIIADEQQEQGGNVNFDSIYPVGSVYISIMSTNPNTLFGGTWEAMPDRFLLGAGNKYAQGTTGGSETHTHNFSHTHSVPGQSHSHSLSSAWAYVSLYAKQVFIKKRSGVPGWNDTYQMTGSSYGTSGTGSGNSTATDLGGTTDVTTSAAVSTSSQNTNITSSSNNMPPYEAVYMWKRTA